MPGIHKVKPNANPNAANGSIDDGDTETSPFSIAIWVMSLSDSPMLPPTSASVPKIAAPSNAHTAGFRG